MVGNSSSHSAWSKVVSKVQRLRVVFAKYWWILLLALAIGGCLGAWNAANQKAVYVSSGRMMVSGKISLHESTTYSEELNNFFGTQIALMQSGEVRRRAAARLQATNPEIEPVPVTLEVNQLPHASIFVLTATGPARLHPEDSRCLHGGVHPHQARDALADLRNDPNRHCRSIGKD